MSANVVIDSFKSFCSFISQRAELLKILRMNFCKIYGIVKFYNKQSFKCFVAEIFHIFIIRFTETVTFSILAGTQAPN